jgi:hypothetical protein
MNSPYNATAILKSLIIYAVCVTLAIVVGYLLTSPLSYSLFGFFTVLVLILISPLLMRWHYPLLIISWNMSFCVWFIQGRPNLWLVAFSLSMFLSLLERALSSNMHFIRVPQITWPLIFMIGVVLITAKLTGGIGVRALGSTVYGGKKYVALLVGILSYFALTSRRIPRERAWLYVGLFFLCGLTSIIGDLYALSPRWATPIFWFFPPTGYVMESFELGESRLGGISMGGFMLLSYLMARYGIRGIFLSGRLWRPFLFVLCILMVFCGGFRSQLFTIMLIFTFQFFMEGLYRTRLLPLFAFVGLFASAAIIPLAPKLPYTVQRTMAFLPLELDPLAKAAAQDTVDWRIKMWKALLPQVPQHLLLGKGLGITPEEFNEMMGGTALAAEAGKIDPSQNSLALSYDYHNGPLSVLIPFGIWGAIAVIWFFVAGLRVLYGNYLYGDPSLKTVNLFLYVNFLVTIIMFLFVGGGLSSDVAKFAGYLGLGICLNGGACQPVSKLAQTEETFARPAHALPQPRPFFPQ